MRLENMSNLLIISVLNCLLDFFAPIIIAHITKWIHPKSTSSSISDSELRNIKHEMNRTSMIDEFSKYARLQRKCNKLQQELLKEHDEWSSAKSIIQNKLYVGFQFFNGIVNAGLLYMYRGELVIDLPKGTLWPLEGIFSWPSQSSTGISFLQWTIIVKLSISFFK